MRGTREHQKAKRRAFHAREDPGMDARLLSFGCTGIGGVHGNHQQEGYDGYHRSIRGPYCGRFLAGSGKEKRRARC